MSKGAKIAATIFGIIFLLFVILVIYTSNEGSKQAKKAKAEYEALPQSVKDSINWAKMIKERSSWKYEDTEDEMSGLSKHWAKLTSYQVRYLDAENGAKKQVSLILNIVRFKEKNLVMLESVGVDIADGKKIKFSFDGKIDKTYSYSYSSLKSQIEILNNDSLIELIKKSTVVTIYIPMKGNGIQQYNFNPSGLTWDF